MNKFFAIIAISAMTSMAFAATTATAKINIASASGNGNDAVILIEGTTYSSAYESGADAYKLMNDANDYSINLFAVVGGDSLSAVATNDLSGTALTFKSNKTETDYTMTFKNVSGTVKLYDAVTGTTTILANDGTYPFTCAADSTIADRFFINYVPAAPEICHRYGKLQVTGMKDTNVVVKNMDDSATSIGTVAITANYQEIDLAGLAAGQYKVEYNDGTAHTVIIDVK